MQKIANKTILLVGSLCLIILFCVFYAPISHAEVWELKSTTDRAPLYNKYSNNAYIIKLTGKITPPLISEDREKIAMETLCQKKIIEEVHHCSCKIASEQDNSYILGNFIQYEHYVKLICR